MQLIYIVEDDPNIQTLIESTLRAGGFASRVFPDGESFFRALHTQAPALALLDIMLPGESGLEILMRLRRGRKYNALPVILLTAKSEELDKVTGLDMGADDYITKPFSVLELISRVKAALRHGAPSLRHEEIPPAQLYRFRDIEIDTLSKEIRKGGSALRLTYKEYELFLLLYRNAGIVLSRDQLLEAVWGYDFDGGTRTVDVHINSLRRALGDSAEHPRYIATMRGHGYKFLREEA